MFKQNDFDCMRTGEIWFEWKPNTEVRLLTQYKVEAICDIIGAFYIVLAPAQDAEKKIKILYEQSVESHRRTNRVLMKKSLTKLICEEKEALVSYYKVENSAYARWLSEESYGCTEASEYVHLVFAGENCIVDVVAGYEPKIEFIE